MASSRINARLSAPLAEHVQQMVGSSGVYETRGEYIRDLIRHDMERHADHVVGEAMLEGYRDLAEGRVFESSGRFGLDMVILDQKEANGWQ